MLNSAQVKSLFAQEAVLFGTVDGVPFNRVSELFGLEAAEAATRMNPGSFYNIFEHKGHNLTYVHFIGFQYAASFANVYRDL